MAMTDNKDHWYDGRFYDLLIAPNQDRVFKSIREFVEDRSSLLDVGCGTGRLAFTIADKCSRVVGIDLSKRNIDVARRHLAKRPAAGIEFHHGDALQFLKEGGGRFDTAVLTYVLHEMDPGDRVALLRALATAAGQIVVAEYAAPQPRNLTGVLNTLVERAAGAKHFANFREFVARDGLVGLSKEVALSVAREVRVDPAGSHIMVMRNARMDF